MKRCFNLRKILFVIFLAVFVTAGALAAFQYSGNNITSQYLMGQNIKGKVNISFSNQPVNSILSSNFDGNITSKELLDRNNANYQCYPATDCLAGYMTVGNPITQFSLNGEKVIGFKVTGSDVSIQSISLKATGDIGPQCTNQLIVDILDNNEKLLINPSYENE